MNFDYKNNNKKLRDIYKLYKLLELDPREQKEIGNTDILLKSLRVYNNKEEVLKETDLYLKQFNENLRKKLTLDYFNYIWKNILRLYELNNEKLPELKEPKIYYLIMSKDEYKNLEKKKDTLVVPDNTLYIPSLREDNLLDIFVIETFDKPHLLFFREVNKLRFNEDNYSQLRIQRDNWKQWNNIYEEVIILLKKNNLMNLIEGHVLTLNKNILSIIDGKSTISGFIKALKKTKKII